MNKTILLIVLVVAAAALVGIVYYATTGVSENMNQPAAQNPSQETGQTVDSDTSINADLENVDLGNVDGEFQSIDQDINSL